MAAKRKQKHKVKIIYDVRLDRFRNVQTGRFIDRITGLLFKAARRMYEQSIEDGSIEKWKRDLQKRVGNKVEKRIRKPPPTTPHKSEESEMEILYSEDMDEYLDAFIFRNLDYMDEEVIY